MTDDRNIIRRDTTREPWFHQEDLRDAAFYQSHAAAIHDAIRHGRIIPTKQATSLEDQRRKGQDQVRAMTGGQSSATIRPTGYEGPDQ